MREEKDDRLNKHVLRYVKASDQTVPEGVADGESKPLVDSAGGVSGAQAAQVPDFSSLSRSQRAADAVTEFCGSWIFIIAFSMLTGGWIVANTTGEVRPDPYPYILLNLLLTVVSTFQSPLIMMSQNRQMERDRDAVRGLHAKLDALAARLPQ